MCGRRVRIGRRQTIYRLVKAESHGAVFSRDLSLVRQSIFYGCAGAIEAVPSGKRDAAILSVVGHAFNRPVIHVLCPFVGVC